MLVRVVIWFNSLINTYLCRLLHFKDDSSNLLLVAFVVVLLGLLQCCDVYC